MFSRIVTSALFAGASAGLIASLLQLVFVQPVLLHAELYESGHLVHFGGNAVSAFQDVGGFEAVRDGLSIVFTMAIYTGYAFILVAAMALADQNGHAVTARQGILWGLAGFVALHFAPGFSLAPEVPGVAAAEVFDRQIWWFATVCAAAIAMGLIGFARTWPAWIAAALLLMVPHLVGAPQPESFSGPVPTELGALFAARSLGVGFAAWVLVGLFSGFFWQREGLRQDVAQEI